MEKEENQRFTECHAALTPSREGGPPGEELLPAPPAPSAGKRRKTKKNKSKKRKTLRRRKLHR